MEKKRILLYLDKNLIDVLRKKKEESGAPVSFQVETAVKKALKGVEQK